MVRPLCILPKDEPWVTWRPGVDSRLHTRDASLLCVLEQRVAPGAGAPTHTHFDVEEIIVVLSGTAVVWIDGVEGSLEAGDSVILPPHSWHGFRNQGTGELHTLAVFASHRPLIEYEENPDTVLELNGTGGRRFDRHRTYRQGG